MSPYAVSLFSSSNILPLMLHAEKVSSMMFDISCLNAPSNICDFFTKANSKHNHETRFSLSRSYYVQTSRLNQNQGSFPGFGAKPWDAIPNEFRQLSKGAFKKHFHDLLLSIMETEDDYVEVHAHSDLQVYNALIIDRFFSKFVFSCNVIL